MAVTDMIEIRTDPSLSPNTIIVKDESTGRELIRMINIGCTEPRTVGLGSMITSIGGKPRQIGGPVSLLKTSELEKQKWQARQMALHMAMELFTKEEYVNDNVRMQVNIHAESVIAEAEKLYGWLAKK